MKINKIMFFFAIILTISLDSLAMRPYQEPAPLWQMRQQEFANPVWQIAAPIGQSIPLSEQVEYVSDDILPGGVQVFKGKGKLSREGEDIEIKNINNALIVGRFIRNGKTSVKLTPQDAKSVYEELLRQKAEKENKL
jgi:hypothetical protein